MNKRFNILMAATFVVYIGSFFGLQILAKDKEFSELENRKLASKPDFSKDTFINGEYGKAFETYIADQFPGRDYFISVKSYAELAQGKKDNNGVYIGKDGYLLQTFQEPDQELMNRNANYINAFSKKFNTYIMTVPTATKVLEEKLPPFAQPYDEGRFIEDFKKQLEESVNFVSILDALDEKSEEYIYYKTDHHWTTLGAYYGYVAFCESYGIEPLKLDQFNQVEMSKEFYGTLFSKGNFTFLEPDSLFIFEEKNEVPVKVNYTASNKVTDTLYQMSSLETKDKYNVFLDGNHPNIVIETGTKNGKKIMVIKDSYANSFIPFLTAHFEEIHILDLRFLNMPIATYATSNDIEDILMLYNVQNFAKENKLSLLGQ